LRVLRSSIKAESLELDLPATAHFRSVGRLVVIYSAQSLPVWPVAPRRTRSYSLDAGKAIIKVTPRQNQDNQNTGWE
jgi:hypothetical protein